MEEYFKRGFRLQPSPYIEVAVHIVIPAEDIIIQEIQLGYLHTET